MAEEIKIWHAMPSKGMANGYVGGIFKFELTKRGVSYFLGPTPPIDFNLLFFTVYDPLDIFKLKQIRKRFPNALIIAGGIEGFTPAYILCYADYVNAGEGWEFLRGFPADKGISGLRDWLEEQPYISSRAKTGKPIEPSYFIPWAEVPIVKVSDRSYYYLCAKGCRNKCAFCFTSWMNPFQINPVHNRKSLYKLHERGGSVYFVGNDTGEFEPPKRKGAAASISVKRYLQNPSKYTGVNFLHIGIEGFTEARRAWYGKPIKNEEIQALMQVTKNLNQLFEMFLIVQAPDDISEMVDALPIDTQAYPRIFLKFTHIDPEPGTPLEDYNLSLERVFNRDLAYNTFNGKNRRFRSFPILSIQAENTKSMLRRATMEQAETIIASRSKFPEGLDGWREYIQKEGLWDVYCGKFVRQFPMKHPHPFYLKVKEQRVIPNAGKV
jgi:hypothetical protein